MNKDKRIQGLIEANNLNIEKRRALARKLREVMEYFTPGDDDFILEPIREVLDLNGPS